MSKRFLVPVGALVLALGVGGSADAGQRDSQGRDRNGRASQGRVAPRQESGRSQPRAQAAPRSSEQRRGEQRSTAPSQSPRERSYQRGAAPSSPPSVVPRAEARRPAPAPERAVPRRAPAPRSDSRGYAVPRGNNRDDGYRDGRRDSYRYGSRDYGSRNYGYRNYGYRYYGPPRLIPGGRFRHHYYGSGGHLSVYFGIGRGYLFGAPYYGRVYGYVAPRAYGVRIYYGDVRLDVHPRDAAVYVDGYYAGIVDDFDGVFQRLTLEVGAHQIELDAPGLEPQLFDVYVDPAQTVTIHADLYPY